jgi:hypothetical protein
MSSHTLGFAPKGVRNLLRVEGLVVFAAAIAAFVVTGGNWWLFAVLILAPDLAFLAAAAGEKAMARAYNIAHTYTAPAVLAGVGLVAGWTLAVSIAIIWIAHIGIDRALGYGLKYERVAQATHLGWIGKASKRGTLVADPS